MNETTKAIPYYPGKQPPLLVADGKGKSFVVKNYILMLLVNGVRALWQSRYGENRSGVRKWGEHSFRLEEK